MMLHTVELARPSQLFNVTRRRASTLKAGRPWQALLCVTSIERLGELGDKANGKAYLTPQAEYAL